MRTDLEHRARDICFERLAASPFKPWLFEHTPAAAESAADVYLAGVEDSDLLIWLAGANTSEAVQRELQHGLDHQKPFLVFSLPVSERDDDTGDWIARMRDAFKTKDIADLDGLGQELDAALDDFLATAVRAQTRGRLPDELAALGDQLRGLAITRWLAVGVSTEKARGLAADLAVGALPQEALPSQTEPLRVLQAPVGAGKTLAAVRFMQRAMVRAHMDSTAPLPIWVEPRDGESLDRAVETACERAGHPPRSPVVVVVDGLDEASPGVASLILERARILAFSSDVNRVLLTSRPTGLDVRAGEMSATPVLNVKESVALIERSFGIEISEHRLHSLPSSVRAALARPLFSLLLGRRLASGQRDSFAIGDLIASLVSDAIGRSEIDELSANRSLASLAALSLERGTQAVDPRNVGTRLEVRSLLETRLVTESAEGLSFSLPILREWFGGMALQMGLVRAEDLVASPSQVERWRYAIFMALATLPFASVDTVMRTLAEAVPGFASEAMAATAWQAEAALPPALELGERLYQATESLSEGLGRVGTEVGPRVDGDLATLGVRVSSDSVAYAWARASTSPRVTTLPEGAFLQRRDPAWSRRRSRGGVSGDPLAIWRIARDDLGDEVEAALGQRVFFPDVPEMRAEAAWLAALELQPIGEHYYGPLDPNRIHRRLDDLSGRELLRIRREVLLPLQPLREVLAANPDHLSPPYATPDLERTSWVWSGFSPETLLSRTRAVYSAAVSIYEGFVEYFFPAFAPSLLLHLLFPARLRGILRPVGTGGDLSAAPGLTYVIDPLPRGARTEIEIQLVEPDSRVGNDNEWAWGMLESNAEAIERQRPDAPPWLTATAHSTVLEVFGADPATRLAENWLAEDLRRVGWLQGRRLR